jgi:hypothetical protein
MHRTIRNILPIAIVIVAAVVAYAVWPSRAQLILLTGFAVIVPMLNARMSPSTGWGVVLRQRRVLVAYLVAIAIVLTMLWALSLAWLPPSVCLAIMAVAVAGWSLFMIASIGPEGLRQLILPDKSAK